MTVKIMRLSTPLEEFTRHLGLVSLRAIERQARVNAGAPLRELAAFDRNTQAIVSMAHKFAGDCVDRALEGRNQ